MLGYQKGSLNTTINSPEGSDCRRFFFLTIKRPNVIRKLINSWVNKIDISNKYNMIFQSKYYEVQKEENGKLAGNVVRTHNNLYMFDDSRESCYLSKKS